MTQNKYSHNHKQPNPKAKSRSENTAFSSMSGIWDLKFNQLLELSQFSSPETYSTDNLSLKSSLFLSSPYMSSNEDVAQPS